MTREARNALIRAHQNNIDRYCRLLATELTDHEREYVHKRIVEERTAMDRLLVPSGGLPNDTSEPPADEILSLKNS